MLRNGAALFGIILWLGLGQPPLPAADVASTPSVQQRLEALSTEFYAFNMPEFLCGVNRLGMGSKEAEARHTTLMEEQRHYEAWITRLLSIRTDKETLLPLLKHSNPKVRTLALALLADLNDPSVLPAVADCLSDGEITFLGQPEPRQRPQPEGEPLTRQATIGSNARSILFFYVGKATFDSDYQDVMVVPTSSREPFDAYWAVRKDRKFCASWFDTKIRHRSGQATSSHADYKSHLQQVHAEIDQLPEPDRTWTLLWLSFDSWTGPITSSEELIPLLQKIGPDVILEILRTGEIPSSDPDIRRNPGAQRQMVGYLFKHSEQITRLSDIEAVRRYRREFEEKDAPHSFTSGASRGKGGGLSIQPGQHDPLLPASIEFTLEADKPSQ